MAEIDSGYYAVIPAGVRHDRNVCNGAKLLYGEITALCGGDGRCRIDGGYFAALYEEPEEVIDKWISSLQQNGHIRVEAGSILLEAS